MFLVPYGREKSRLQAICFWMMSGPRSIKLSKNFDDGWLDRHFHLSTYTPVGRNGRSLQLFTCNEATGIMRYLEWSHENACDALPKIDREFLLLDALGMAAFYLAIEKVVGLAPFRTKSTLPEALNAMMPNKARHTRNIRVERTTELGYERLGFSVEFDEAQGHLLSASKAWGHELSGERIDVRGIKERFDADPFENCIELDFEDFESLFSTFELPIELG